MPCKAAAGGRGSGEGQDTLGPEPHAGDWLLHHALKISRACWLQNPGWWHGVPSSMGTYRKNNREEPEPRRQRDAAHGEAPVQDHQEEGGCACQNPQVGLEDEGPGRREAHDLIQG